MFRKEKISEQGRQQVEKKYPTEVKKLMDSDDDWQDGFNSGLLAVLNLVFNIIYGEEIVKDENANEESENKLTMKRWVEQTIDEFPMLST